MVWKKRNCGSRRMENLGEEDELEEKDEREGQEKQEKQ